MNGVTRSFVLPHNKNKHENNNLNGIQQVSSPYN